MSTRHSLSILAAAAAALVSSSGGWAASAPAHAALVIRHETRGCHSWAVNGGPFKATQSVSLRRGGWITITDDDVMPHLLVQTSGPAKAAIARVPGGMHDMATDLKGPGLMAHMGATVKVSFARAGVYRFTTKAGEDYMPGVKTVGEDNALRLTVRVS
ncbi:MAG: hypothetical protein IRZ20_10825 [Thermoleophilia bacterium]|nr:hypothetical protein [Thermoleophilia bacterium]